MNGNNKMTVESYLDSIAHPRKKELASMLIEGKSFDEIKEAGFGKINIQEAVTLIKSEVEGKEEFSIEFPGEKVETPIQGLENESETGASSVNTDESEVLEPTVASQVIEGQENLVGEGSTIEPAGAEVNNEAPTEPTVITE